MNPTHQITPSDTRRHDSSPMPMMWSPTGSDTHSRSTSQNLDGRFLLEEEGYLHDSEEDSPPIIRRTFAFDEWDDDEKTGTEDHEKNDGTTRSESSKSSVEKIKDRPKKNVHGMFSDDDDATVVENKKGSDDVTSDNEEARSTTSTHNTEKMTNLFQNSKFDVDENKHTAITPSATTKATGHPFPLYSYQSFGRATLSSLDTTSTTLFLNDSFDYGLSHTNNGSALLTMNSSSNNISPEVLSRPNFHPSDSHQCASIPRQAAAFYHHHQYYYDHPHEVTAKMAPSNQSNDYGNHCLQKLEYGTNTSILQDDDDDDDDDIFESSTSEEIPTSIPKFIMFQKKHNK